MTEYWVSQAKFYCKYCSCWIADNKPSKQHHDGGVKHKLAVEMFNKKKREEKLGGIHSEKELQYQLAEIDKAAREAVASDRSTYQGQFFSNSKRQAPPPPPRNFTHLPNSSSNKVEDQPDELSTDKSGIYEVRGQKYLEGQLHQDKLKKGLSCEIFVEAADEWLPAVITARKEVIVPNTEVTLTSFTLAYKIPRQDELDAPTEEANSVTEDNVRSDRLRLLADKEGNVISAANAIVIKEEEDETEATLPKEVKPVIVESTGLGAWQTVSVRVVDEEAEKSALLAQQEEERRATTLAKAKKIQDLERAVMLAEAAADAESALGSYDPYHTNVYKGVKLGSDVIITEIESVSNGKKVAFKKRKGAPGGGTVRDAGVSSNSNSGTGDKNVDSGTISGSSASWRDETELLTPADEVKILVTIKEENVSHRDEVASRAEELDKDEISMAGGVVKGATGKPDTANIASPRPLSFAIGSKVMGGAGAGAARKIRRTYL